MHSILVVLFRTHDGLTDFLVKHMVGIKRGLLIVAHLSIFGFFFPELRKDFGSQAINLLYVILFLSPLSQILGIRLLLILMSYRRQLGILMAYLATVHGLGYLLDPLWVQTVLGIQSSPPFSPIDPRYLVGIAAYFLTLPLLLTSNTLSVRLLKQNWKRVHFLVYGVFAFAVLHQFTVGRGFADTGSVIQAILIILFYVLVKFWAHQGLPVPLQKLQESVELKYGELRYRDQ